MKETVRFIYSGNGVLIAEVTRELLRLRTRSCVQKQRWLNMAAALDFPPKYSQKNASSAYSASKPYSVHSAIGSRMNGIAPKRTGIPSRIVPNERALKFEIHVWSVAEGLKIVDHVLIKGLSSTYEHLDITWRLRHLTWHQILTDPAIADVISVLNLWLVSCTFLWKQWQDKKG